ncbi:hypothetical protein J5N97_019853 [Dioscorea zingiberensis]|uniref:CHHC U11-48K-type domain-containing protein n=1 Tax=Dioscorea zingiberensis TaxID=325984 RepID=A0A9D5CFG9_9LILI|nr:hypothetical protein J5N97_019853 [Dioscorea zingiberensis]
MDPSVPSTYSFTPLPPNPNPNPVPVPNPTASTDVLTTISLLKSLISFANSTLTSFSELLALSALPAFIRCPFNSSHRMPPEALFRHSLICPSAPGARLLDLAFLDSLRYPGSFQSPSEAPLLRPKPDADLILSLDEQLDASSSNFFYKDCHGVVAFPQSDGSRRSFMLPAFLASECSDFVGGSCLSFEEEKVGVLGILPSEFFSLKYEVGSWTHCPVSYSCTVLRVAAGLQKVDNLRLKRWIILNSVVFGVVIDSAMRDHIFLLLKLCLKVIEREAVCTLEVAFRKDEFLDQSGRIFECPRLVGSLNWLASQLSVLYGQMNSNFFAVGMAKESLLCAGSCLMLFKAENNKAREDGCGSAVSDGVITEKCEMTESRTSGNSEIKKLCEVACEEHVFVYQVAAAVSALHERFLLEEKIKLLRFGQPITKAQLITEHSYISTRSSEERINRPDYKAVLEHDGLLWQRAQGQDTNKEKTREELLAEERDYKRRRMSYRGKKVKRTLTQVMRDIIEEHMEEINQAGGIGGSAKATPNMAITAGFRELESRSGTIEAEADSSFCRKPLHAEYKANPGLHGDACSKDGSNIDSSMEKSYKKRRYQEDHKRSDNERVKNYGSKSPSKHTNYGHLRERYPDRKAIDYDEEHRTKYNRRDQGYSFKSKDYQTRSTLTSTSVKDVPEEEHHHKSKDGSRHRGRNSVSRRSAPLAQNGFEDRYDPYSSYDGYDTAYADVSVGSNSVRALRYCCPPDDDKYQDELATGEIATKRGKRDHHTK